MRKILIAIDDNITREAYAQSFQEEGFRVFVSQDGNEVLNLIQKEKPDVVLLDISLEKMVGFDVFERLKKVPGTENIKIIMFCQIERKGDREKANKIRVEDFVIGAATTVREIVLRVKIVLGDIIHYQIPVDMNSKDLQKLIRDLGFRPISSCERCPVSLNLLLVKEKKEKENYYKAVFICPICKDIYFEV